MKVVNGDMCWIWIPADLVAHSDRSSEFDRPERSEHHFTPEIEMIIKKKN